jgi:hypothetical protein
MDEHVKNYFMEYSDDGDQGHFHRVISLHDHPTLSWEEAKSISPLLPRGWFELSRLPTADRLEFIREHWQVKMPYHPHDFDKVIAFFDRLDDVGIFLTQQSYDDPVQPQMVYSLKNNGGFYHGYPPAPHDLIAGVQERFADHILPADYIAFLEIHDGFSKYSDTGLARAENVIDLYETLQNHLKVKGPLYFASGEQVNPHGLIPFYESFGLHCYQCFSADWFPESEMGNVYYSGIDHVISDPADGSGSANQAFTSFIQWLGFYTESAI